MSKKTIVLGNVSNSGIYKVIKKNIEYYGYEVIDVVTNNQFTYPNIKAMLKARIARLFNQKEYKKKLKKEFDFAQVSRILSPYDKVDYALFSCAQAYAQESLALIKSKVKYKMVNFQQDGIARFKDIWNVIDYFDRVYVFDHSDLNKNTAFLPATNCYFDYNLVENYPLIYDFYFIGSHDSSRQSAINKFIDYANTHNLKLHFILFCKKLKSYKLRNTVYKNSVGGVKFIHKTIDYEENLKCSRQAKVLVDFVTSDHKGLSYRVFEALGYDKKLITTNETVKHYDFYHPNNIFVWNGEDLSGLEAFLAKPYQPIDEAIKKKYSFGNWLNYMLDIQPHTPITLPKM